MCRFKGGLRKCFGTLQEAEEWLERHAKAVEASETLFPILCFAKQAQSSLARVADQASHLESVRRQAVPLQHQQQASIAVDSTRTLGSPCRTPRGRHASRESPYFTSPAQPRSSETARRDSSNDRGIQHPRLPSIPTPEATAVPPCITVQRSDGKATATPATIFSKYGGEAGDKDNDAFTEDEQTPSWVDHFMSPRSPGSPTARLNRYSDSSHSVDEDEEVALQLIPRPVSEALPPAETRGFRPSPSRKAPAIPVESTSYRQMVLNASVRIDSTDRNASVSTGNVGQNECVRVENVIRNASIEFDNVVRNAMEQPWDSSRLLYDVQC